jgi:hypothetical protein
MKRTAALAVPALALVLAPAASAAVKTKVSLINAPNGGAQLQVKLTSKKAFTRATRPRAVKVTAGAVSYKLKRTKATRKASTWRSPVMTGADKTALTQLVDKRVKVQVKTKRGKRTVRLKVPALPPTTTPNQPPPNPPGAGQLVRNDAAGRQAMANAGDLLLEWYQFGSSGQTAEYRRIWVLQDGSFRRNVIDWNSVSGEICRESVTGTWAFKEGYTSTYNGGGVVVKLTITLSTGQSGDDLLSFPNASPNTVYVGTQSTPYERNPQIMQNC